MIIDPPSSRPGANTPPRGARAAALVPACALIAVVLIGVGATSTYALLTFAVDGLAAVIVLLPGVLGGLWLVPLFGLGRLPLRWHFMLGGSLGIGLLSLLVLAAGLVGVLSREVWIVFLVIVSAAGFVRLRLLLADRSGERNSKPTDSAFRWVWLITAPFLILAVLAAVHAPGYLWSEEGGGYDALEYHLELPKEYRAAGRISYTPHNVYGSFPANVEMLYLLAMVVLDEDMEAGTTAHMIHLALAVLTVFAAYVAGREWSPRAGAVAGVVTGSCGWLVYLSGLAYVEHGLLLFGMTAVAVVIRTLRPPCDDSETASVTDPDRRPLRWFALAGVCAGFACGCKYTGIPMLAIPVAAGGLIVPVSWSRRFLCFAVAITASFVTLSPWLIKNTLATGNPVFPLANRVFRATPPGWGMAESDHWDYCHSAAVELEDTREGGRSRLRMFWQHVLHDRYGRFGPLVFLLAASGCFVARIRRQEAALLVILFAQLIAWIFGTHLYARFAVVLLIPLALLAGRCALIAISPARITAMLGLLTVGAGVNFLAILDLYRTEAVAGAVAPASYIYEGAVPGYEYLAAVNNELPKEARVLVVGDAKGFYYNRSIDYWVVFNRGAFVDAVSTAQGPADIARWLQDRNYTHVLVHAGEIRRLRRSAYGFPSQITMELFSTLEGAGYLERIAAFGTAAASPRIILYRIVPPQRDNVTAAAASSDLGV